ncbi:MAG: hypothetical protein J6C55_00080, partial [Oscillospiraceae bacterium]|nr:hypothetical protein [Oscillospiraceae bacterium]
MDAIKEADGADNLGKALSWTPIGKDYSNRYTGIFEGNNKTISGLYFNNDNQYYVGLFGYVQNGTIKDVGVKNSYFKARDYVGGLIGNFDVSGTGEGKVSGSYSSECTVTGTSDFASVGGLIGNFSVSGTGEGKVSGSYSSECTVTGSVYVGGLIG